MASGIIIIDKEPDWTSHDVVAKLRSVLGTRKIGHGGTLDPMATGVLPVFVGRATRAADYAAAQNKDYEARMKLGLITDTQDITGTVLEERPVSAGPEDVESVLSFFRGEILQTPPMYSAIKIGGKKLYELARKGVEIPREPRKLTISQLSVIPDGDEYILRATCSKGTYVRTLCHDIGLALGCGAVMTALRRTRVGAFTLEDAVLIKNASLEGLMPVDRLFSDFPEIFLDEKNEAACRCGAKVPVDYVSGRYRVYGKSEFLMLGQVSDGVLTTIKNFFEV